MGIDNRVAVLTLVASDDSYQSDWPLGSQLQTFPDSARVDEVEEPDPVPEYLLTSADLTFQKGSKGLYFVDGWQVADKVTDSSTGFGAVIFQNEARTESIVAFTGTNGLTPQGVQGWYTDLTLARTQWSAANSVDVLNALDGLAGVSGIPGTFSGVVHFTGQSLGGALAQFALFDYAIRRDSEFDPSQVTLTTFNALGVLDSLALNERFESIAARLEIVPTTHFATYNDIIHRLGGGFLNGSGNTYQLKFTRTVEGREVAYDVVDTHRIESGFYRGFTNTGWTFENAKPYAPSLISAEASRSLADGFGNLLNDRDHSPWESGFRIVSGIAASLAINPSASSELANELLHTITLQAETDAAAAWWRFFENAVPWGLEYSHGNLVARATLLGVATYALAAANTLDRGEEILEAFDSVDQYLLESLLSARLHSPSGVADFTLAESMVDGSSPAKQTAKAAAALGFASGTLPDLPADVGEIIYADLNAGLESFKSGDWLVSFLRYVTATVAASKSTSGATIDELGRATGEALGSVASAVYALESKLAGSSVAAQAALQDLVTEIEVGAIKVAQSLSNAHAELVAKHADAFEWGAEVTRKTIVSAIEALASLVRSNTGATGPSLGAAVNVLEATAQAVAVLPNRAANPFDDDAFDANAAATSTGHLKEGSISTLTTYLAYAAPAGGQRVRVTLLGDRLEGISVFAGGEKVDLGAGNSFAVTVSEGQREASFELVALADIDEDRALVVSATLVMMVDGQEVATHLEHEETTVALDADSEASPITIREIRGDWAPKPYDDGAGVYHKFDDLGNIERLAGVANTTGFSEPDNKLDGSNDADHIVTGDYEDAVYGFDGDDSIAGSGLLPTMVNGGAGNDWIEAFGYASHASDYFEINLLGRTVGLGDDKLYGGAGDDFVYGESEAYTATLYDANTAPTGLPGDWISGGSGRDVVFGSAGNDVLMGGIEEDRLVGGPGKDVLIGDDHYSLRPEGNFWTVVHPNYGNATSGYAGFEFGLYPVVNVSTPGSELIFQVTGDPYFTYYKDGGAADVLIGGAGDDILIGQAGDDTLYGGDDNDIIAGWEGADLLYGGSGDDLMAGDFGRFEQVNQRTIDGVASDYRLVRPGVLGSASAFGSAVDQTGNDFLDGGAGNDIMFGEGGDDVVLGGDGNDVLWGDATYLPEALHGDDLLDGGAGNDFLSGNAGNDKLYGGDGDDALTGGSGNDLLEGGADNDTLGGGDGHDVLRGGSGFDTLAGDAGSDRLEGGSGDDHLSGGDDDDILIGDAGADILDGGAGNDTLYGGAGEDVIEGGEGDDLIDGGAGIDVVRGGEGNDTYVVGLGYGRDLIEDTQGENRIRLGSGILPIDLAAQLDSSTLAATLQLSAAGDSIAFDAGSFDIAAVEFASGLTWRRTDFVNFMPAVLSLGSNLGDVLLGNAKLRNHLEGGDGGDQLVGAQYADVLVGGAGEDTLDGSAGSDRYVFRSTDTGVDAVSDSGLGAVAYLTWYYGVRGIDDWAERGGHGGQYRAAGENTGDGESGNFVEYFETFEAAYDEYPFATITYVEPLPEIAPVVTRNDTETLAELAAAGVLETDFVEFVDGIAISDLELTLEVSGLAADLHPEQPWYSGGTLSVRWGSGGFDVAVPDVRYGFPGTHLFQEGVEQDEDLLDGSWRGYRLGEGVEAFRFADGSVYALEEVLQRATLDLRYGYEFLRGSGFQIVEGNFTGVDFGDDIAPSDIYAFQSGPDLAFGVIADSALGRIPNWYADPATIPQWEFRFADGTVLDTDSVTRLGRTRIGSPFNDFMETFSSFASALVGHGGDDALFGGSGNDLLDGGPGRDALHGQAGNDIYVFGADSDVDFVNEQVLGGGPNGIDTVRFAADVSTTDLSAERSFDSLTLRVVGTGAELQLPGWFAEPGGTVEIFEFADGTTWYAADVEALLEPQVATDGDDVLLGLTGGDVLEGGDGDDAIYGFGGNDMLIGGPGYDFLHGGAGDDTYVFNPGAGVDEISDRSGSNVLRFGEGIDPRSVAVSRDQDSLYLSVAGSGDRVGILSWFFAAQPQLSQVSFADGTNWTVADLLGRIGLAPASDFDDILWGTDGADVIHGLAGDDQIYGNAGNDVLDGGEDADYLESGEGHDILRGGAGDDDLEGWPGEGHKLLEGGEGDDYIYYEWRSIAIGGPGDDWIDVYGFNGIVAFNPGDGADTIGANESFTLSIGGGIGAADLSLSEDGADLVISVGAQDSVRLTSDAGGGPGNWPFMLLQLFGSAHVYNLGGVINEYYGARAANSSLTEFALGDVLPRHLILSSETGALGGVIAHQYATRGTLAHVSDVQLLAVIQDPRFGPFFQDTAFEGGNGTPALEHPLVDVAASEDAAFAFAIPADTFADPDVGDTLAYAASLEDGSALPGWLSFDAATRTFSGTPLQADVGTINVKVMAADAGGLSADDTFELTVANVNDAPLVAMPLTDLSFEARAAFNFTVPAGTFSDEDPGDTLAISAAIFGGNPLPGWLTYTPETQAFAGNPSDSDIGIWHLQVTATDAAGASAASDFGLVIRAAAGSEVVGTAGDDILYGGTGDETLTAKGGSDYLYGDVGDDLLKGGAGNDVLQGGDGADVLRGGKGQNVLDGGAGEDLIFGGKGSSLIVGGTGNDTIRTGSGSDVILFNRGDGMDTVIADRDGDNTLSFGGGIRYSDLSLSRDGKNLVVSAGGDDQIIFKNWYGDKHSVLNLQIILDATEEFDAGSLDTLYNNKVQTFDFLGMVSAFDSARAESPGLTSWAITNALLQFHLSGMDDAAFGGDLAYWYGKKSSFSGLSLSAAQQAIGAPGFGSDAQTLRPFDGLQEGFVTLA